MSLSLLWFYCGNRSLLRIKINSHSGNKLILQNDILNYRVRIILIMFLLLTNWNIWNTLSWDDMKQIWPSRVFVYWTNQLQPSSFTPFRLFESTKNILRNQKYHFRAVDNHHFDYDDNHQNDVENVTTFVSYLSLIIRLRNPFKLCFQ